MPTAADATPPTTLTPAVPTWAAPATFVLLIAAYAANVLRHFLARWAVQRDAVKVAFASTGVLDLLPVSLDSLAVAARLQAVAAGEICRQEER